MNLQADWNRPDSSCASQQTHAPWRRPMTRGPWVASALLSLAACSVPLLAAVSEIRFGRDILPVLSEYCFSCHGPDMRQAKGGLRLDEESRFRSPAKSGRAAIVPGQPDQSELIRRIESNDASVRMPPPETHRSLGEREKQLLRTWIQAGAPYERHWAFVPPARAVLRPNSKGGRSSANPIDHWIQARLDREKITPLGVADRRTILRRLSYDLTGLPPTPGQLLQAERDPSRTWVARTAEALLQSPHFGERMAMWWMDVSRYADTDGFQADDTRSNWPWRDWVVEAFNENMPFDHFTIAQFAGDLLERPTAEHRLATAFHRHHMTNGEGGRDPEESRVDYVIDRVNTMGTAWLGLTLGCAQCHSHKFDPISQSDYYGLTAFFNSIDEDGKAGKSAKPFLTYRSRTGDRALAEARQWLASRRQKEKETRQQAEKPFRDWLRATEGESPSRLRAWHAVLPTELESSEGTRLIGEADGTIQAAGPNPNQDDYRVAFRPVLRRVTGLKLEVMRHESHTQARWSRGASGEFILTDVKIQVRKPGVSGIRELQVASAIADASADKKTNNNYGDIVDTLDDDPRNGWTTRGVSSNAFHRAVFAFVEPAYLEPGEELVFEMRHRSTLGDANIGRFKLWVSEQPGEAVRALGHSPLEEWAEGGLLQVERLESKLRARLFDTFLEDHPPYQDAREAHERARRQLDEVQKSVENQQVMVLAERGEPRSTYVLQRGVWDQHGEQVQRSVPSSIAPWREGETTNRLGLARWIVSRDNPLTARVLVNHLWQLLMGQGLVRTPEDFGLQGERPTHPELLDWLAVDLMESEWNIKHLLLLMVTSEAYQRDSRITATHWEQDPENRWWARGPRYRLPSWMLRDAALSASELLNPALGGPPVRPYQPEGIWEEMFMGRFKYVPSGGSAQHRRTLYAFWRRSVAPAFLFDSAQRRVCEVRTPRTNTPLQALTLLNDRSFLNAALALADRALESHGDDNRRLQEMARRILSRKLVETEFEVVQREWNRARIHYESHPNEADLLLAQESEPNVLPASLPASMEKNLLARRAAFMIAASMLFNLDEALTHE